MKPVLKFERVTNDLHVTPLKKSGWKASIELGSNCTKVILLPLGARSYFPATITQSTTTALFFHLLLINICHQRGVNEIKHINTAILNETPGWRSDVAPRRDLPGLKKYPLSAPKVTDNQACHEPDQPPILRYPASSGSCPL